MVFIEDGRQRLKQHAVHALRSLGLLGGIEWLNRRWTIAKNHTDNDRFRRGHPDFIPLASAAMHDAYGTILFQAYWEGRRVFCTAYRGVLITKRRGASWSGAAAQRAS
jgi:hypothetical protein